MQIPITDFGEDLTMANLDGWTKVISFSLGICLLTLGVCSTAGAQDPPVYKVDASWPKQLPNNWIMGQVGGMAVDKNNHIWVIQRPSSNVKDDVGLDEKASICCTSAPPVLEFDAQGNFIKSWGGPAEGYDWPVTEHSIFVDQSGNVWITGNGTKDRHAIKFTNDGKFMLEIGHPSTAPMNNADTTILGRPAGIEVDEKANEVYIADGYLNRRVIVFDSDTGAFKRMWGAYGNPPSDADLTPYNPTDPPSQLFRNPVHCARMSRDGFVYVCDRVNNRIQVFTKEGKFVKEFFVRKETIGMGSVYDLTFSPDAGQKYLLVADGEDNVIWIVRRSDGTIVGTIGHAGRNAGQFHHVHGIVEDSDGNLYTGEVDTGRRIQKFALVHRSAAHRRAPVKLAPARGAAHGTLNAGSISD
jgi:DNA-binding beta-propeller fold protein YncE